MTDEPARHHPVAGRPASVALAVGVVTALVAGVLLVRDDVAAAPEAFDLPSVVPSEAGPTPPDLAVVAAAFDDLTGLALGGPAVSQAESAGLLVDAAPDGSGCRGLRADEQGQVQGWARGGWLTSVQLLRTGEDGTALPLGSWVDDSTDALLEAAASSPAATEEVRAVRRDDLALLVRVVTVDLAGGELVLSDLGAGGGHRWAELRQPAGRRCEIGAESARRIGGAGPLVGPDGARGLAFGTPVESLLDDGVVVPEDRRAVAAGCVVVPVVDGPDGVTSVVVADGALVGVGLSAGGVRGPDGADLVVGDPVDRVRAVFPAAVGPGELQALRDNSGVVVPTDGGRVVVSVARPSALVPDVDVPVPGPDLLVSSLQVSEGC